MPKRSASTVEPELNSHSAEKSRKHPEPPGASRRGRAVRREPDPPVRLKLDPQNANLGTARGEEMIDASIRNYGAGRSGLADRRGTMLAGNKTLARVKALGIPVKVIDSDGSEYIVIRRTDLDLKADSRARELSVVDNRANEVGLLWDPEALAVLRAEGLLDQFFRDDELARLFDEGLPPDEHFKEYDESAADGVKMVTCPHCGKDFPK